MRRPSRGRAPPRRRRRRRAPATPRRRRAPEIFGHRRTSTTPRRRAVHGVVRARARVSASPARQGSLGALAVRRVVLDDATTRRTRAERAVVSRVPTRSRCRSRWVRIHPRRIATILVTLSPHGVLFQRSWISSGVRQRRSRPDADAGTDADALADPAADADADADAAHSPIPPPTPTPTPTPTHSPIPPPPPTPTTPIRRPPRPLRRPHRRRRILPPPPGLSEQFVSDDARRAVADEIVAAVLPVATDALTRDPLGRSASSNRRSVRVRPRGGTRDAARWTTAPVRRDRDHPRARDADRRRARDRGRPLLDSPVNLIAITSTHDGRRGSSPR